MGTLIVFGLSGLCAWYIIKIILTGMAPARYGPDIDLRKSPISRWVSISLYGCLMIFGLWAGILMLNKP